MAKKKKQPRKKKQADSAPAKKTPNLFWRQVVAFLLIVAGLFVFFGAFGWGGALPVGLFKASAWMVGYAAFLLGPILIYWGILKFKNESHKIPPVKLISSVVLLSALAGVLHVFVERTTAAQAASDGAYGGNIGNALSGALLSIFNSVTAFVVFLSIAFVSMMVLFGVSPKRIFAGIASMFRRERDEDEATDLSRLKAKEEGFKINAEVPLERPADSKKPQIRPATFKNSAVPLTITENHAALTAASDPTWKMPPINLLNQKQDKANAGDVQGNAEIIKHTLENFGIDVEMEGANVGPRVTQFTLKPPTGVKLTKITALENNLALDLAAHSIRMEAPIPGQRAVGIEVPNLTPATVRVSSLLQSSEMAAVSSPLGFVIGKDISGKPIVADLAKMPHLLVAGQTGSGKSVMINTILASLLYRNSPADLKLILVDPKFVELGTYNGVAHLLTPVITEPEKCISALKWAVAEMERRLRTMADADTSNITEYNAAKQDEGMPQIVIVIDELADLMMMAARDVEALIVRLAQKARAAGIHLILATQRPSVNVITGLIKANVPARIAFTVASQIDSRTIIDQAGAEKLLGMGDMLFYTTDMAKPRRVQGALIEKPEIVKVTQFIKDQRLPQYNDEVVSMPVQLNGKGGVVVEHTDGGDADDDMWHDAVQVVVEGGKASTSLLQRRLRIGYGRASRLIDMMEEQGIVGAADGSRPREVLVSSVDDVFGSSQVDDTSTSDDGARHIEVTDARDNY